PAGGHSHRAPPRSRPHCQFGKAGTHQFGGWSQPASLCHGELAPGGSGGPMGKGAINAVYTKQDLQRYRNKTQRCLDALSRMLAGNSFAKGPERMGLELELNLVDDNLDPAMANQEVLKYIDDPAFQTELGQHNIEINVPPRPLAADEARGLEQEL